MAQYLAGGSSVPHSNDRNVPVGLRLLHLRSADLVLGRAAVLGAHHDGEDPLHALARPLPRPRCQGPLYQGRQLVPTEKQEGG